MRFYFLTPLFYGMIPIIWSNDPLYRMGGKLTDHLASTHPALWSIEKILKAREKRYPISKLLLSLYRYISGDFIYQGYRERLRDSKMIGAQE
jgi:hypothetical protein